MKYYEVIAKCGHVGRNCFYRGVFYVEAEDGKQAAAKVRQMPRVKHDRKDAILNVNEITQEEYKTGKQRTRANPYFKCKNIQEQRLIQDEIEPQIFHEKKKEEFKKQRRKKPYRRRRPINVRNFRI